MFWAGLCYQKIGTQALPPATAHVPIGHLPPPHLCLKGTESDQDSIKTIFLFISPLPPQASSGTPPVVSDEEAEGGYRFTPNAFLTYRATALLMVSNLIKAWCRHVAYVKQAILVMYIRMSVLVTSPPSPSKFSLLLTGERRILFVINAKETCQKNSKSIPFQVKCRAPQGRLLCPARPGDKPIST